MPIIRQSCNCTVYFLLRHSCDVTPPLRKEKEQQNHTVLTAKMLFSLYYTKPENTVQHNKHYRTIRHSLLPAPEKMQHSTAEGREWDT